ncbi:hypothetical protein M0802_002352 [Mischocyttarus mexicanus]|nr:hypothetical protein M0802_002352 [Mischocyttarus mexicanus]
MNSDDDEESLSFCLPGTADNDAVQALLARYLQKRLQGTQLSTLPPPAVIFNSHHRAKVRQAAGGGHQKGSNTPSGLTRNSHPSSNYKDNRKHREDYVDDDYVDDLQGFEDSDRSRTRIDLLAVKTLTTSEHHLYHLPSNLRHAD